MSWIENLGTRRPLRPSRSQHSIPEPALIPSTAAQEMSNTAQTVVVHVHHRQHFPSNTGYNVFQERPGVSWEERRHEYEHAATVDVQTSDRLDALKRALRMMRHKPSTADSGTVVELHHEGVRRSSIGDVLMIDDVAFEVQDQGFAQI